tara:strand:+ start:208 stop:405 length:198 start_codon:yes stop_codon:yes gene_type:complete
MTKDGRSKKAWKYSKNKTPLWKQRRGDNPLRDSEFRLRVVPHKNKDRRVNKQDVKKLLYNPEEDE